MCCWIYIWKVLIWFRQENYELCCFYLGEIYVCGGFDGYSRHTSMERYTPRDDQWSTLSGMAVGREGAGLVVAGDKIYCIGGYDGINLLDSAERYCPVTEQWETISPMTTRRSGTSENLPLCLPCVWFSPLVELASVYVMFSQISENLIELHQENIVWKTKLKMYRKFNLIFLISYEQGDFLNNVECHKKRVVTLVQNQKGGKSESDKWQASC